MRKNSDNSARRGVLYRRDFCGMMVSVIRMKHNSMDQNGGFDPGSESADYAKYCDIYPFGMYEMLSRFGIGAAGQRILDLGSGPAILPLGMAYTRAQFVASDIAEDQIALGARITRDQGIFNIDFRVCAAEDTGFPDNSFEAVTAVQSFPYFDAERAAEEIHRILIPGGLFCIVTVDRMPPEEEAIAGLEALLKKYDPQGSMRNFGKYRYTLPAWMENRFEIATIHSFNVISCMTRETWLERIKDCRGACAEMPTETAAAFEEEYRRLLADRPEPLKIMHDIHIEIYRCDKA